jgi:hypothetical protein
MRRKILDCRSALDEPNCAGREAERIGIGVRRWLVRELQRRDEKYGLSCKLDAFLGLSVLDSKAFCAPLLAV